MIWVTGCKGLLGKEICRNLSESDLYWQGTDTEVDITNYEEILKFVKEIETKASFPSKIPHEFRKINWIINCAGFYSTSDSEDNKEKIFAVNSKGITNLARVSREIGSKIINISYSDVFDGNSKEAYTEDSIKNPISIYGQALADGETSLKKEMNQYYIIRNSFVYGLDQNNYFYKLINQLKNESSLSIPDDIYISPVNACDLSSLIIDLIKKSISAKAFFGKNSAPSYGIYNFADENSVSLYDFAKEVNRLLIKHGKTKNVCNINPCSKNDLEEYKSFLYNSSLNNSKICKEFKIKTPLWTKSLEKLIKDKRFI